MANQAEIEAHYDVIGTLHALRLGYLHEGYPDYSCAFFDGNYSKALKQAQEDKHTWIFNGLGLGQNLREKSILDIGCGWGPILHAVRLRGGSAIGLTLSSGQKRYCEKRGLDVKLLNYKDLRKAKLGPFDGIISVGAFEHFCSPEDAKAGKQMEVYQDFFEICTELLRPRSRLFVQTMVWGKKVPNLDAISLSARRDSEEAIIARLIKFYPGSWLPNNLEQIKQAAEPHFKVITSNNGRLDYIETLARWSKSTKNLFTPSVFPSALSAGLRLLFEAISNADTRILLSSLYYGDQTECFKREIMTHERIFFEKI
jgi:cyclopropane-fatty-acyl-phospholipid synthase